MAAAVELLRRELAELDDAERSLIREYGVCSAAELEAAMNAGKWPEHPTWERIIEWEGIEDRRKALRASPSVGKAGPRRSAPIGGGRRGPHPTTPTEVVP